MVTYPDYRNCTRPGCQKVDTDKYLDTRKWIRKNTWTPENGRRLWSMFHAKDLDRRILRSKNSEAHNSLRFFFKEMAPAFPLRARNGLRTLKNSAKPAICNIIHLRLRLINDRHWQQPQLSILTCRNWKKQFLGKSNLKISTLLKKGSVY